MLAAECGLDKPSEVFTSKMRGSVLCRVGSLTNRMFVSAMVEFQCSQTHASEMLPSGGDGVPGTRRACWGGVARRRVVVSHDRAKRIPPRSGGKRKKESEPWRGDTRSA